MKRTAWLLLVVLSLLLAACQSAGGSPGASPGPGDGPIDHPTGGDPVVIVEYRGGFVPPEFLATQLPTFVLLGDGRVITQGAQPAIFPGPALPALLVRTLSEEGIQTVLTEVVATNVFGQDLDLRGAANFVADAPDTVFTVHAGGRDVTVSVYALGFIDPAGPPAEGITQAEIQAHQVLNSLNNRLTQLESWLPADAWADTGWNPYEPEAFRLYLRDATADPADGSGMPQQVRIWPLDGDPAAFGEEEPFFGDGTRCGVVEGEEAAIWLAELQAANQLTRWSVDGASLYAVTPRPLLPYEEPICPDLGGGA